MTHDSHDLLMANWLGGGRGLVFTQFARDSTFLVTSTRDASGAWGPPVRLPLQGAQATRPRVSADGQYVAFFSTSQIDSAASGHGKPSDLGIGVLHIPSGKLRLVARWNRALIGSSVNAATAAWGKGSATVYYAAPDSTGRSGIWSVPIGGGTPRLLFRDDPKHRLGQLRFATDDKRLFITIAADESDVFVMELKKP